MICLDPEKVAVVDVLTPKPLLNLSKEKISFDGFRPIRKHFLFWEGHYERAYAITFPDDQNRNRRGSRRLEPSKDMEQVVAYARKRFAVQRQDRIRQKRKVCLLFKS